MDLLFEIHPVCLTHEIHSQVKDLKNQDEKKRRKTSFCDGKNEERTEEGDEKKNHFLFFSFYSLHHHYHREMLLCVIFNLIKQSIEAHKKKQRNMLRLLCSISVNNYRKCDQIISIAVNRFFFLPFLSSDKLMTAFFSFRNISDFLKERVFASMLKL